MTPPLSLDTMAFDTRWWEREQKKEGWEGLRGAQERGWGLPNIQRFGQRPSRNGCSRLMVKSIGDGDGAAKAAGCNNRRLQQRRDPPPTPPPTVHTPATPPFRRLFR